MAIDSVVELFEEKLPEKFKSKPHLVEAVQAVFKFVVGGDTGGTWLVDLTQAGGDIRREDGDAACTVQIQDVDLLAIINGKLNAQMAFMTGKLKVSGDLGLALKLGSIIS